MWFGGLGKPAPPRTRQREGERFGSDLLTCPLGEVYDLSATGIRLRGKGRCRLAVGQCLAVTLQAPQGALTLQARVVRIQRHGLRMFDVGMQFIAITPATARALKTLAEFGFVSGRGAASQAAPAASTADSAPQQPAVAVDLAGHARLEKARAILRVSADATAAEIKAAYRQLAREFHPDVRPGPGADQQFADIADAYQMLRAAMSGPMAET
jgi:hypothetical protein